MYVTLVKLLTWVEAIMSKKGIQCCQNIIDKLALHINVANLFHFLLISLWLTLQK